MPDLILSWGDIPAGGGPVGYGTQLTAPTTIPTGGTGGIEVTVVSNIQQEGATTFTVNQPNFDVPAEGIPEQSALKLFNDGIAPAGFSDTMTTSLIFGSNDPLYQDSVTDVSFRLFDIDSGDINDDTSDPSGGSPHTDNVTIRAFDADGNEVSVVISPGSDITVTGNTLQGDPATDGESSDGSISSLIEIAGPIARIEIDYNNGGTGTQEVLVSDLLLTTIDSDINDDPDAVDDAFSAELDKDVTFNVLGNDSDPDGDPITLTSVTPLLGTVTFTSAGEVVYTPPVGFVGTDTLTYTISDGNGGTDIATVTITVDADVNDPPVAVDDTASTPFDTLIEDIDVIGNDTDPDGDTLSLVPGSATTAEGTVTENPDGTLNFDPTPGFEGPATITYTITDGVDTDTGTLTVTVSPDVGNTPPVAVDDFGTTPFETPLENIDIIGNDTDADGDTLELLGGSASSPNGDVSQNPDGTITFEPAPGFVGDAIITYTVVDGNGGEDTGNLTVTVTGTNAAPVAVDDTATTPFDTLVEDIDVIGNDTDPDDDTLSLVLGSATSPDGTVTENPDGTLNFDPTPGFTGPATITYTVTDGADTDTGTLTVTVDAPINTDPDAVDDIATTPVDTLLEDIDVLGNDSDPDGDPLTVIAATASNGTVSINPDGTLDYQPDLGFSGPDTITYAVDDGNGGTDTAIVTVAVGTNDSPVAVDDADETTPVDTLLENIDVLSNDSDPDGDPLEVVDAFAPNGTVTINPDGTLDYQPDLGFEGEDTITYQITDNISGNDNAELTVLVGAPNTDPDADPDTSSTAPDTPVTIFPLGNDTDPEGDPLTITAATVDPAQGTVTVLPDGTRVEYTPAPGFEDDVATITYTISDGNGGTDTTTIQVLVGTPPLDGIVEGTGAGEYIGEDDPTTGPVDPYLGDPEGDQVDNNDAIALEAGSNDDVIEAGGGDDTVEAGEGNDNVDGGEGDDIIDAGEGDDFVLGDGFGDPATVNGDDSIDTGDGDDTVFADDFASPSPGGDDTILTGDGNDSVGAGGGDDVIDTSGTIPLIDNSLFPSFPDDDDPEDDRDFVDAGEGNDLITTGDDADTIIAGEGDDTIISGIDDDSIIGDGGDDLIEDVHGADTVDGGDGDDTINVGVDTFTDYVGDDPNLPITDSGITFVTDPDVDDGRDLVFGGAGNDVINTGDDADTIDGGDDDDTINAGIDDDRVLGGSGDDSILGGHGSDTIFGQNGDDFIDAGHTGTVTNFEDEPDATEPVGLEENDRDSIEGGAGNDTIIGGDDDDTIRGGSGADEIDGGIDEDLIFGDSGIDTIDGGDGDDTIDGGFGGDSIDGGDGDDSIIGNSGDDTVTGGEGADSISTGAGQDSIVGATADDTVDGGSTGPVDFDVLDLRGAGAAENVGGRITIDYDTPGSEGGVVKFLDAGDVVTGTMRFDEIENVIPCFTPGTLIATPTGERKVEGLQVGDRVITRDNGIQEIRWAGAKDLTGAQLAANDHMQPILIQAGALGNNLPERDILVSPQHRMLLATDQAAMYFEEREVLVAAKHLTILDGVDRVESSGTTYIHIMFDQHEVVLSNGTWSESFQPGDYTLDGIGKEQRDEILELFPELATQVGTEAYQSARRTLKKYEAALLCG